MKLGAPWIALAVLASLALAPSARGADLAGARAFVAGLYAHYPAPSGARPFDPTGRSAGAVFDPPMVALLREDTRLAGGEVGAIDSDPLCDCQDDAGLKAKIGSVQPSGASGASVIVDLRFSEASPPEAQRLELSLAIVNGRWRIHDIKTKETPSLRAYLIQSNHAAAALKRR
jgi:hypothetical protein